MDGKNTERSEFVSELNNVLEKHGCVAVARQRVVAVVNIELSEKSRSELSEDPEKRGSEISNVTSRCAEEANALISSERWGRKYIVAPQFTYVGPSVVPSVAILESGASE